MNTLRIFLLFFFFLLFAATFQTHNHQKDHQAVLPQATRFGDISTTPTPTIFPEQ